MKRHLFYTLLVIFAVTSIVTILGVLDIVHIRDGYLYLFATALIIESAGAVIGLFRKADFFSDDGNHRDVEDKTPLPKSKRARLRQQEFDQAKEQVKQLKSKLDEATAQNSKLEQTLALMRTQKHDLDQARAQISRQQDELAQANKIIEELKPLASRALKLPITVNFRKATFGAGLVLVIQKTTTSVLSLNIKVSNSTFKKTTAFSRMMSDGIPLEIGHMEGWAFSSGDHVEISNAQYAPLQVSAP